MGFQPHDPSSETCGDLIHMLIKATQSTQVPRPPAYCKNIMKGYTIMNK
jgi:hypothetical protein